MRFFVMICGLTFGLFLLGFIIPVDAQYMGNRPDIDFQKTVETLVEQQERQFRNTDSIISDSIKYKIYDSGRGGYPPLYSVKFLYDQFTDGKIQHRQVNFGVGFGVFEIPVKSTLIVKDSGEYVLALKKNSTYPILCRQGFENVSKHTGIQVCVTPKSIGKLIDREWLRVDSHNVKILKNENYDSSLHVPITVNHKQILYKNNLDHSYISIKIWNLRNIQSDYSVKVLNPYGEVDNNCSQSYPPMPQKAHSLNEWRSFPNSCGYAKILGNYTVIVSSKSVNEEFIVEISN